MKKLSTYLFLILFSFQTPSWADDIRDFQIEGMSIGDSLLDYVNKNEIEERKVCMYKNKKVCSISKEDSSFKIYDAFQVHFKTNDKKYIIESLDGMIGYKNDIQSCYEKMDEIVEEISSIFKSAEKAKKKTTSHPYDKSGKSKSTDVVFWFDSGDLVVVECADWSEEVDFFDKLKISLITKEHMDFINKEAYE